MSTETPSPEQLALISKQLADIDMPPPPDWGPTYLVIGLLFIITLIATALQLRHRYRQQHTTGVKAAPRHYALTRLEELETSWRTGHCDPQTVGFRLATTLRLGLGLTRLDITPPIEVDPDEWRQLYQTLYQLRYTSPVDPALINQALFDQARHYLTLDQDAESGPC